MSTEKPDRVIFRKWKVGSPDVIAFFPDIPWNHNGDCTAYMHVGQHGSGTYPHPQTVPASYEEYKELLAELRSQGYDNLRIVRRVTKRKDPHAHN